MSGWAGVRSDEKISPRGNSRLWPRVPISRLMPTPRRSKPGQDEYLAPADEKESLSPRMLELIEIATVEERRESSEATPSVSSERRRRTDQPGEPERRAS